MDDSLLNKNRLGDRIFYALKLAIEQRDLEISDSLVSVLELAMTRKTGGGEFVERREYSTEIEKELTKLRDLKRSARN